MKIFNTTKKYLQKIKNEYIFIILFIFVNLILAILNRNSQMMGGLLDYYIDFKNIISHNFNLNYSKMKSPAFPMWGYGWFFLISTKKFIIYFIQFLFCIYTLLEVIFYLKEYENISTKQIQILKVLLLISFSFLAINYTLSPYSLAINLQILSILYFIKSSKTTTIKLKVYYIILSSILFGLLLNFRSDYIYFSFVLPITLYFIKSNKLNILLGFIWIIITFSILIPWMIFTNFSIGKPLLTSTNSGHVFYIGLGNLPNNKWNITTSDLDPRMYEELRKFFGSKTSSLRYEEDKFLKKRFIQLVKNDPFEYIKKVSYACYKTVISGIYVPEFYNVLENCSSWGCKEDFLYDLSNKPVDSIFEKSNKSMIYLFTYFSIFFGILIIFLAHLILPIIFYNALKEKNLLILLSSLIIVYQLMINSFAFQMKLYSTYSYLWALILIITFQNKFYKKH